MVVIQTARVFQEYSTKSNLPILTHLLIGRRLNTNFFDAASSAAIATDYEALLAAVVEQPDQDLASLLVSADRAFSSDRENFEI